MRRMDLLLEAARPAVQLFRCADRLLVLPPLAPSLLPDRIRTAADDALRAYDEFALLDVVDKHISDPELLTNTKRVPRRSSGDREGLLGILRRVLGPDEGSRAVLGVDRFEAFWNAGEQLVTLLRERGVADSIVPASEPPSGPKHSIMEIACSDVPPEVSEGVLALGRSMIAWFAFLRADEQGREVAQEIRRPLADLYINGAYPLLRGLAAVVPVPDSIVPRTEILCLDEMLNGWAANQEAMKAAVEDGIATGDRMSDDERLLKLAGSSGGADVG